MPRNESGNNTDMMSASEPTTINNNAILNRGQFAEIGTTQFSQHGLNTSIASNIVRSAEPAFDFQPIPIPKERQHEIICHELESIYARKNHDYGDSFGHSYDEYGLTMAVIRLSDKLNRLKSFIRNNNTMVQGESIEDTLMDLANYSIMTVIELRNHR